MDTVRARNCRSHRRSLLHRRFPFKLLPSLSPLLLLLFLTPAPILAQDGAITGTVSDGDTGTGVAAVEITVLGADGTVVTGSFSSESGTFRITGIPPGTYTVRFTTAGWRTHTEPGVVVTAGQATGLSIGLQEQMFNMNPITATVQRGVEEQLLEAPASVHVVDQIQIKSQTSLSTTDFIQNVSGVDVITTGLQGNYFVTRGFNNIFSGAVMFLTDYRIARVPSLRANISHLNPTVPTDIGRIEVVLGPGSAVYGPNTANGVIHQITTSPIDDPGIVLSVAGGARKQQGSGIGPVAVPDNTKGLFQTQGRLAFKASDKFGIKVSGQFLNGTDFVFIDPEEVGLQQAAQACLGGVAQACLAFPPTVTPEDLNRVGVRDSTLNNWSVDVRADWRPSDDTDVIFSYGHTTSGTSIDLTGIGAGQVQDWSYDYFQTRVHWKGLFANVYFNKSNAGDTYLLQSGQAIVDKSNVFATQLQNTSFLGDRQTFTYGADLLKTTPKTDGTINGQNEDNDNITEVGAFVQSQTALSQKFDLVLALRADYNSVVKPVVWSPRAAFMFKPTPEQNLRVTYNRAFSSPTTNNLFLDLLARVLPIAPGIAYPLNTQGTTDEGFTFSRTNGRADFKSPFAPLVGQSPATFIPTTTPNLWGLAVAAAGALDPALGALLGSLPVPTEDQVGIVTAFFDPGSLSFIPDPRGIDAIDDIPAIDNQITNTIEFGYKGLVEEQFLFDFAFYWSRIQDFIGPLGIATPNTTLNGADIAAYVAGFGVPADIAAQIGEQIGSIPLGVITPEQATIQENSLLFTYQNFGDFDVYGLDFSAEWQFEPQWFFGMRMNWVNKDMFNSGEGGDDLCGANPLFPTCVSLNAPKFKTSGAVGYRGYGTGFFGEFRVRYLDGFFANSGTYSGPVDGYTTVDLGFGYSIPSLSGMSVQVDVTNLFDNSYQSFPGTPFLGRVVLARITYDTP
jgi:iron complex outermembrane receptor protein